jgi:hypothetical protein
MRILFFLIPMAFLTISGCDNDRHHYSSGSTHVHQPLKGGKLFELGPHGSGHNLELLMNEKGLLELYILDAHADHYVRIKQAAIELTLKDTNRSLPRSLLLHAVGDSATGETVGNTALFRSTHSVTEELPITATITSLAIGSKTYTDQEIEFMGNSTK